MANNHIAHALSPFDEGLHLGIRVHLAKTGIHRVLLRKTSIVSADSPAHQTQFSLFHASCLQTVNNVIQFFDGTGNFHFRLIFNSLYADGRRKRLPSHTDANLHSISGILQLRTVLYTVTQRHTAFFFHLVLAVKFGHIHIAGIGHLIKDHRDIFIWIITIQLNLRINTIYVFTNFNIEAGIRGHALHAEKNGVWVFTNAADRHTGNPCSCFAVCSLGKVCFNKSLAKAILIEHIARISGLCAEKIALKTNVLQMVIEVPSTIEIFLFEGHTNFFFIFFNNRNRFFVVAYSP